MGRMFFYQSSPIRRFLLTFVFILLFSPSIFSQTGLFAYSGGFFIQNGNSWTEYRPSTKSGAWATYTTYAEDTNYYCISNNECSLSIPKADNLSYFIGNNGRWDPLYTPIIHYNYFNDSGRDIYCHTRGYFIRDGKTWREYLPSSKQGMWADYKQVRSDENFIYLKNSICEVAVPKKENINFYIFRDNKWEVVYYTSVIYDKNQGNISLYDDKNKDGKKEEDNAASALLLYYLLQGL